jgi:acyl-CoA synthetase (NDP forming)
MNVAIIGASSHREKYGNKALRSHIAQGHTAYPVNPNEAEVEGLATFKSVQDIPGPVDRALLYVPASVGITVLEDIAQKGIRDVYVNPGAESDELLARGEELGLNMIQACAIIAIGDSPAKYK